LCTSFEVVVTFLKVDGRCGSNDGSWGGNDAGCEGKDESEEDGKAKHDYVFDVEEKGKVKREW